MSRQHSSDPKLLESAKFSIIAEENITIQRKALGRGAYGTVHAAVYDGKSCVVKEIHPFLQRVKHKHSPLELVFEEINTLSSLRHPSIVQFLGVYFKQEDLSNDPPIPILVMERMWKSLYAVLEDYPKQLSLINKAHILHDIICGLRYLHNKKKPIIHRDLTANNILLNEYLVAKIADLGQARALELIDEKQLSTAPGNTLHMPPEALVPKPRYNSTLDMFSFGCITIHTITEKLPIPTDQFEQLENGNMFKKRTEAERRQQYLDLMDDYSELQAIAMQCIEDMPTARPNACQVCNKLQEYIEQVEKEFPALAEQYKQDKLSLICSNEETKKEVKGKHENDIKEKEEYISLLESQLHDSRSKMEQDKNSFEKEKDSLQMKLAEKDEMNKELSKIFQEQVDKLRGELKAYNVTCIQLQQQIQDLKQQLKHEKSNLLQEKQNVVGLQGEIQLIEDKNQKEKLAIQHEKESLQKVNEELVLDNQLLKDKSRAEVTNILQEMNLNIEHQRELFERKLKEQENEFAANQIQIDKFRADKEQLEEMFCKCRQEKESLQRRLDEQQTDYQILTDRLRENARIELNEANHQIQRLQNELKSKTADLEVFKSKQKITDPGSRLHQKLLEIESTQRDDRLSLLTVTKQQEDKITKLQGQLTDLRNKLKEKAKQLSTLESSLNELSNSTKEKLKLLEENTTLKKQLENNDRIQSYFDKELISKEESLKRKEEELQLQKKEHADEINNLQDQCEREINDLHQDIEMYKSQIIGQGEISSLFKKEAEYKSDLEKSTKEDRFQKLDDERKSLARNEKKLKSQIKHKDADIREKAKLIESLEQICSQGYSNRYHYNVYWYPYLSLPVKLIGPSVAVTRDKVFVTSGYQSTSPQGRKLEDYSQTLEDKNGVFCFHMAKCHCDTIASPVLLGALASMNGQCVLVSGADSVENTLTGNVYVLCEEGSHDQWREFSKPLPTPRILACACCYGNRWLIVCGGFSLKPKEKDSLLEAVNVMEILDTAKGEWYTLPEEKRSNFSTLLCCAVVGEEVYVVSSDQVIKTSCNKLIKAATSNNTLVWDNVPIETEDSDVKLYPFSVVEVNGEPMIIASMTDGEDDVTCVLMKDTRGRWRIISKAVECQHCSAAVVTSSLELLLFGGSEKISVEEATEISYKSSLIPTLNVHDETSMSKIKPLTFDTPAAVQGTFPPDTYVPITVSHQPPNLSFTGPIHTIQFDHNGGTFQSPIHKISLVVLPNALSDGEKVTVHMGATTSGPFDLPEDCKLRSAVVWLSISPSDVVFKRSISVILPHSAVFTSSQHHNMMRFITCEDYKGPRYSFSCSLSQYEIDGEQGVIELNEFAMVAIIASPEFTHDPEDERVAEGFDSDGDFQDAPEDVESLGTSDEMVASTNAIHYQESSPTVPPACFLAKLFWPHGELPRSFRADVYYIQNLPTELYKVDTLYKKQYYEENGAYPEIMDTEFILHTDKVKCVLPCHGSSKCDCLREWDVIQMSDTNEVQVNEEQVVQQHHSSQSKFSLKFTCDSGAPLTCCFEFQGAKRLRKTSSVDLLPPCLQKHFTDSTTPFIMERGISHHCQISVPVTEPVKKMYAHEIVHDKSHEVIVSNSGQGVMTDSPPLKNLL